MTEPNPERMRALEARIAAARSRAEPERKHMEEHYSQAQLAWRMVIELVAGLVIGFGIGYGLDRLLGTGPWLLVVFTLLGFVAGVKTMIRSAHEIQAASLAQDAAAADKTTAPRADADGETEGPRNGD